MLDSLNSECFDMSQEIKRSNFEKLLYIYFFIYWSKIYAIPVASNTPLINTLLTP